jgi:HAD superfamily hydrolase (TIGR01450 family)
VSKLLLTRKDLPYIATNPDLVCPTEYGSVPDCGSVCEMIYNATGRRPVVIGKPSPLMPELAMEHAGFAKEETAVVGDRIYTDVAMAHNAGAFGVLVLSGETTLETAQNATVHPDLIVRDIEELGNLLVNY